MRRAPGPLWETPKPRGVHGSYGPAVIAWAEDNLGIVMGPWQAYALTQALRYDRNGDILARVALISTGRQNGKSVIVRAFYGWLLDVGRTLEPFREWTTLLAAAHDAKQARIIYGSVLGDLLTIPRITEQTKGRYAPVRLTEFRGIQMHGLTFDTVTSQPGSARGLSAGAIAWDEMLTQTDWDMWEALSPTQSAQRSPIMLLTSTAGNVESVVLRAFYDRLKREAAGDEKPDPSFYGAWWASRDNGAALDWAQIKQANPALGDGRLTKAAIASEHRILPVDSWQRERLNHFVDRVAVGAFNPGVWAECRTPGPLDGHPGPFVLGVDVQPGWERATIVAAGIRTDGRIGVSVYRDFIAAEGDTVSASDIVRELLAFPDPVSRIVWDSVSGAHSEFVRTAADAWATEWLAQKPHEVVAACMDVTELIQSGRLAVDDPLLDQQLPNVARRPVGQDGAFRFSRAHSLGPIDGFMAMTLAAHAVASVEALPSLI